MKTSQTSRKKKSLHVPNCHVLIFRHVAFSQQPSKKVEAFASWCNSVIVWVRLQSPLAASSVSSSGRWLTRANTRPVAALFSFGKSPGNCQQTAQAHTHKRTSTTLSQTHKEGCLQLVSIHFSLRRIVGLSSSLSPLFLSQPATWRLLSVRWKELTVGRRNVVLATTFVNAKKMWKLELEEFMLKMVKYIKISVRRASKHFT